MVDIINIIIPTWGHSRRTNLYVLMKPRRVISQAVSNDIPNEDKAVGLFKKLRLEIFAIPCVES